MPKSKSWPIPLFLSGLVLLSQAFPLPSPVRDAATLQWAAGFQMHYPFWHLLFTPFCSLSDTLTVLSLQQLKVLGVYFIVFVFGFAGLRRGPIILLSLLVFLAWGALIPHPMGRLVANDSNTLLIDFHSHTSFSHDGRKRYFPFLPQVNERWHAAQGYGASFITDHNLVDASAIAHSDSRNNWETTGYRSLEGEEVSLKKTHLVILGNREKVDNQPYDGDDAKIPLFVRDMHKHGYPVIASLPEYWFYHWGDGVQDFVRWGLDGFEIINSAPKALDFPPAYRRQIVELCRQHNLFMTGISDNHGYGYATDAWNAMQIPGWRQMDPDELEKQVLLILKSKGFEAVQVLERAKYVPQSHRELALMPFGALWIYWRSLQPQQALSWVFWIWLGFFALRRKLLFNTPYGMAK